MSLDNLRYGSFRPTSVQPEARALPGYGGQVEEWGTYRFMVEALEKKESQLSEGEKKKLGSLALRLTERLQGPALQIARGLGVDKLAEPDGVRVLLQALEKDLLPLRRQAALELYQAGSVAGVLSRQHGEPMSSYCLRRETWWNQLQDLDSSLQVSTAIRGEQLLQHSGLGHLEMKMIRTVCGNDLSDLGKLCAALRDQCGSIHEKERGGKGFDRRRGWQHGRGSGKGSYGTGYLADVSEDANSPHGGGISEEHYDDGSTEWSHVDEEWIDVEDEIDVGGEGEEHLIEENVVCWFAEQGVNAQTCSSEDISMVYDAVDAEISAYYARGQVNQRGFSAPVNSSLTMFPVAIYLHKIDRPRFLLRNRGRDVEHVDNKDTGRMTLYAPKDAARGRRDGKEKERTKEKATARKVATKALMVATAQSLEWSTSVLARRSHQTRPTSGWP